MPRAVPLPVVSLACFALLVAASAASSVPATHLFLPAVGTGPGVPPSYWYTTIWVYNAIGESDNFRLRATGWSGEGRVNVFGSRIANGSQDATTFEMMLPP